MVWVASKTKADFVFGSLNALCVQVRVVLLLSASSKEAVAWAQGEEETALVGLELEPVVPSLGIVGAEDYRILRASDDLLLMS